MSVADRQLSLRLEEGRDPTIVRQMRAFGRKAKNAADKVTGKKPIEGFVDRVLAGEVQGWAFDPNKPGRRVHITARHEGEIIAETLADLPRKDLTRGGKGDGKHGFNLRLPAGFLDGSPRRLRIEASSGRTRVLLRRGEITIASSRPSAAARKPKPAPAVGGPSGALEGVANGVLLGWAAQPKSGGAPAVIDIYDDERYLGSVTADRPRPRREDEPRGAKSFHFRLPESVDEATLRRLRARITGTQIDLRGLRSVDAPSGAGEAKPAADAVPSPAPAPAKAAAERRMALLVFGSAAEEPLKRTLRSWSEQSWRSLDIGRVTEHPGDPGDKVFGPADAAGLKAFMAGAEAVIALRAGETLHPDLARTLSLADPVADVLLWEQEGAGPRRAEAWPLAIQLGQPLGGGYAVRTGGLGAELDRLAQAGAGGERALETALAGLPLRWRRLPAALSSRLDTVSGHQSPAEPPPLNSISLGIWPGGSEGARRTLTDVLAALGEMEVEVLLPASAEVAEVAGAAAGKVLIRKLDLPAAAGPGVWLKRLSEAAAGETVLLCRAGLSPAKDADLRLMARWAMSPLAGAVTGALKTDNGPVAGLTAARGRSGWRMAPAAPARGSAPVLAAPGAFMAVARSKLAAVGGFDSRRFEGEAADLDLCLRLRRMGWSSLALDGVQARLDGALTAGDAAMALLDAEELAAAADGYPAADRRGHGADA